MRKRWSGGQHTHDEEHSDECEGAEGQIHVKRARNRLARCAMATFTSDDHEQGQDRNSEGNRQKHHNAERNSAGPSTKSADSSSHVDLLQQRSAG